MIGVSYRSKMRYCYLSRVGGRTAASKEGGSGRAGSCRSGKQVWVLRDRYRCRGDWYWLRVSVLRGRQQLVVLKSTPGRCVAARDLDTRAWESVLWRCSALQMKNIRHGLQDWSCSGKRLAGIADVRYACSGWWGLSGWRRVSCPASTMGVRWRRMRFG